MLTFPYYHLYVAVISQRDQAILIIAGIVVLGFELLYLIHEWRPGWVKPATWILAVGGYYASLVALLIFGGSGS